MLNVFSKIKEKNFEEVSNGDKAIMITSLLIECAKSDENFSEKEENLIKNILKRKLHLDDFDADKCFDDSKKASEKSVEIYSLTKDIRDNFSKEEIIIIFEYLWQIILSDGVIDDFEASMMSKLTGLFHLTGMESSQAKTNAKTLLNQ